MRFVRQCAPCAALALAVALAGCKAAANPLADIETARVTQQDIVVQVEATGVIQPVDAVQVKSKASGQIVKMPVVVGQHVSQGQLLVQVDPRQMRSNYAAAVAALKSAQANLAAQNAQLAREDTMYSKGVVTRQEYEGAVAAQASAVAQVASAQAAADVSSINLADCTVLAPIAGTVIDKSVATGQVIASATNIVGGGTTLLTVADLGRVLDSALVNESDIGHVRVGQDASVTVAAFPNRAFTGKVLRISPEAIVQQSVTMFPVLISLENREGLLLPGMSTDATIEITRVPNAVAIPNDAIGSVSEARALAPVLGIASAAADSALAGARGAGGAAAAAGTHMGVVFVHDSATSAYVLRPVRLGAGNYEVTQALSGVKPGERVALLSDVRMAASRDTTLQRISGRSGISGMTGGGRGGGGRGGGR